MIISNAIARGRRLGLALCLAVASAAAAAHAGDSAPDAAAEGGVRFVVLGEFAGGAVLDRATGLVWRRSVARPSGFADAADACRASVVAGRSGFRLPTLAELESLVGGDATLPAGHPFLGLRADDAGRFWTGSTHVRHGRTAYVLGRNGHEVEARDGAARSLCVLDPGHAPALADR